MHPRDGPEASRRRQPRGAYVTECAFRQFELAVDLLSDGRPAGQYLCEFLAANPSLLAQVSSLIELGAGTGLAGILSAQIMSPPGSPGVLLTDHDPRVRAIAPLTRQCRVQLNAG